jgi:hypothetical protein
VSMEQLVLVIRGLLYLPDWENLRRNEFVKYFLTEKFLHTVHHKDNFLHPKSL